MRVLFFTHYFPPEGNAPASRTYENARRWVQVGHEVTVITCAPNCPEGVVYEGYRNRIYQREIVDGIDVRRVWTYIAANEGTARRIVNYVSYMITACLCAIFVRRPDIIVATSPQFFCGCAGVITKFLRRIPFVLEIRDIWPESILAVGAMRGGRFMRLLEWLELRMYAAADHIVTVGEGYRKRLLEKGVQEQDVSVIMNGINRDLFQPRPPSDALKRQWGVDGKFICTYAGTIGMACGLEIVLEAAQTLKERGIDDVVFMLVGDGASRKDLASIARELGLKNIIFTGRQPKEHMPDYLALADVCFVHLRKTDLFRTVMPSKIFEFSGMQKPIINGVEGFAAAFIDEAGAGINIEAEKSSQLIEALLTLKQNSALRAIYGKTGHNHVVTYYDRDSLASEYLRILQNVLNE